MSRKSSPAHLQLASDGGDGEVELELDDLDDQTLRALQKYINEEVGHPCENLDF